MGGSAIGFDVLRMENGSAYHGHVWLRIEQLLLQVGSFWQNLSSPDRMPLYV